MYLDKRDRKMILLRASGRAVALVQSGIPWHRRFTFYDQVRFTRYTLISLISLLIGLFI